MILFPNRIQKVTANDFNLLTTNNSNLDRESKDRHFLIVTCKDSDVNEVMSSSINLVIDVTDTNDNAPVVADCPKEFSLKEGNAVGLTLGEIVAYDIDVSGNGTMEFYVPKTSQQIIDIHPKEGVLKILKVLDREQQDKYDLQVVVRDEGHLESTCDILLKVTDVEDCDPIFEQHKYHFKLQGEHFNPLHPIGQVRALDRDLPPANVITYSIVEELEFHDPNGNDSSELEFQSRTNESLRERKSIHDASSLGSNSDGIFDIKSNSGLVYTARPLRRSHANRSHFLLVVMATSGIEQIRTATAEIHIDISQGKSRQRAISSSLVEIESLAANNISNDGKYTNGSDWKRSEGSSHYLKIPLLLGFTCVLVGMTLFVAVIILQAICTKLSLTRPAANLIWTDEKHQRGRQMGNPLELNISNKPPNQNESSNKPRFHFSKVLNVTQHFVKPMFSRNRMDDVQDRDQQEKDAEQKNSSLTNGFRMSDEKQNGFLDSLVTSSSTSSQSLLYSPRRASGNKPSSDSKEADSMDAYRTSTLPVSCRDRRSSGYYSPSRSTFSANVEEAGVLLRNGSRRSDESSRKPSFDEEEDNLHKQDVKPQTADNTLIFRLFDNQKSSTYHGRSRLQDKSTDEGQRLNQDPLTSPGNRPITNRFLWYHDV